jgi:hypothetical protein
VRSRKTARRCREFARWRTDPSAAVHVRFARDERGARPSSLYVDPYDAGVLGAPRGEEFFATVRKLHRWLLIPGDAKGWGRQITGVAANSASMPSPAKFVFAERYADKTFRREDHRELARHPSRRISGLARQARVHARGCADAAVRGHRRPALSVAPQAAAPG